MTAAPAAIEASAVPGGKSPRTAIRVERLFQRYGNIEAVRGIDLTVAEGRFSD